VKTLQELLEARAAKIGEQRALLDAGNAAGGLTGEQTTAFDALDVEIVALDTEIEKVKAQEARENRVQAREAGLDKPVGTPYRPAPAAPGVQASKPNNGGFKNFGEFLCAVRFGGEDPRVQAEYASRFKELSIADKAGAYAIPDAFRSALVPGYRNDMSMGTGSDGGFAVPEMYLTDVKMLSPEQGIVRPRASVIPAGEIPDTTLNLPVLNQGANGVYGGVQVQWTSEEDDKPNTQHTLKEQSITPRDETTPVDWTHNVLSII